MSEYDRLKDAIYQTIDDINLWHEVLQQIADITGITRGTISLRDRATGDFVVPDHIWQGMDHPLLLGWTQKENDLYLNDFMHLDPWIEIERLFHPTRPYALSEHIDTETLKQSPFWEWLDIVGIGDTVVADIGSTPPYWVSINLFYPADDFATRDASLRLLTQLQKTMQNAWRYGLQVRASSAERERLECLLELQLEASILVDSAGKNLYENSPARAYLDNKKFSVSRSGDCVCFSNTDIQKWYEQSRKENGSEKMKARSAEHLSISDETFNIALTFIGGVEEKTGAAQDLFVLTLKDHTETNESDLHPVWESPQLTRRERQLVEFMAKGGRIADFVRKHEMAKSTGHFHWANVKSKLNVKDRAELISRHQIYLQNL